MYIYIFKTIVFLVFLFLQMEFLLKESLAVLIFHELKNSESAKNWNKCKAPKIIHGFACTGKKLLWNLRFGDSAPALVMH